MPTLTIIETPLFEVTLEPQQQTSQQATRSTALVARLVFESMAESLWITARYSLKSFTLIVFGFSGSWKNLRFTNDLYLIAFKVTLWALNLLSSWIVTAIQLYDKKTKKQSDHSLITPYCGSDINPFHIQTKELNLDASQVPAEITVDTLLNLFEEINFDQPGAVGYITNLDGHSKAKLKDSLNTFCRRVKACEPFLGTPSSLDAPKLIAFYKQIEDAARLSLFKVINDLKQFQDTHGTQVTEYGQEEQREYNNLVETRSQLVIDIAIGATACGARYMSDTMDAYYRLYPNSGSNTGSLQDLLFEVLAKKRYQIARKEIECISIDAHIYSGYMGSVGKLLAVPGSANITETLTRETSLDDKLATFFKSYNPNTIKEAIQQALKQDQDKTGKAQKAALRTHVIDWIKDHAKNWKKDLSKAQLTRLTVAIEAILETQDPIEQAEPTPLDDFAQLLTFLQAQGEQKLYPKNFDCWNAFIEEIFSSEQAKEWRNSKYQGDSIHKIKKMQALKQSLYRETFDSETYERLKNDLDSERDLNTSDYKPFYSLQRKHTAVNRYLSDQGLCTLEFETFKRVASQTASLEEVLTGLIDRAKEPEFLNALKMDNLDTEGLQEEVLEWLLVSHNILNPYTRED
jgi:hypothetical protein